MRTVSPEQILVLAFFIILLPLLNLLRILWRRWKDSSASQVEPAAPPPTPKAASAPRPLEGRRGPASGDRLQRTASTELVETRATPRPIRVPVRLGPRDARQAVVLMAIFGPCRALEPEEPAAPRRAGPPSPSAR